MSEWHQAGGLVELGVAGKPIEGEAISGDLHVVKESARGVLLAAIDGVGHGGEASVAARVAADILETYPSDPVSSLVRCCHDALTATRGVVMTVASLDATNDTITWLGVGNVEGRLLRCEDHGAHGVEHILLRAGLVGYQLPTLDETVLHISPGDVLILTTDGIRSDYPDDLSTRTPAQQLAERILHDHFKGMDDAMVLVARYAGRRP